MTNSNEPADNSKEPIITMLSAVPGPRIPDPAEVMTILITSPPGSPGTPPHRHSGPAFGYVIEGAVTFELEGEPVRVVRAGETFWEPGGDIIHYQDGNHLDDETTRFVVTMFGVPGEPMLTFVTPEELEERRHLRFS